MQKYLMELMRYTEAGAPTNDYTYDSAGNPQEAMEKYAKWDKMRYTTTDPETGALKQGFKMFKVTLKQAAYQTVADIDEFVRINAVEYHG